MNKLIKTGVVSFIPEIPATAGRPAFCTTEYYQITEWKVIDGLLRPVTVNLSREKCYSAIPPTPSVPSQESIKPMTGWNTGAISNQSFTSNCEFSFNVATNPIGVICGLTNHTTTRNYYSVKHGFLFKVRDDNGECECFIIEAGKIIQQVYTYLYYMPRFTIRIIEDIAYYLVDEQPVYSSKNTIKGNIHAAAILYLLNDYVIYPEFKSLANKANLALPLNIHASNLTGNYLNIAIKPFKLELDRGNTITMGLDQLDLLTFNKEEGRVKLPLKQLAITSESDHAPSINVSTITIVLDSFYLEPMYAPINGVATVNVPIELNLGYTTDQNYLASLALSLPALELSTKSQPEPADQVEHNEYLIVNDLTNTDNAYLIIFSEDITVNSFIDIGLILNLTIDEQLQIDDNLSFSGLLTLLIQEQIKIVSNASQPKERTNYQYAVNAANFALSLYENFDFIGFANCNGITYAIKTDGLYRLTGSTDNGELINAEIDLGAKDWGMPNIKRVSSAYLGIRSDGDVYLKVVVDDKHTNVYRFEDSQSQRRTFMSKGVNGRYWRMKLVLENVSFAEIDSLEFEVGLSQRRIRR